MELMAWAVPSAQYVFETKVAMKAALKPGECFRKHLVLCYIWF